MTVSSGSGGEGILSSVTRMPAGVIETLAETERASAGMAQSARYHRMYFHHGVSALANIRIALAAAGVDEVRAVLDYACGYGRVLRMLKAEFPAARTIGCDVEQDAVEFCSKVFDVECLRAPPDPRDLQIGVEFDLIWCGSLLTHMPADKWPLFLGLFASHLAGGGVLVFTTHGRRIAEHLAALVANQDAPNERRPAYNLLRHEILQLLEDYGGQGFGYQSYPNHEVYGLSLSRPDWVVGQILQCPSLHLVLLTEGGWAGHQDVVACVQGKD
jgi:SAM-dependent methyltransferase